MPDIVIRPLLQARYGLFALVATLLVVLIVFGRKVQYEQSIQSFFPTDDPDVIAYQRASDAFGNDNVVFIVYDDPALLSSEGMDRVAELAGAVGPSHIPAVIGVQSLDAMPPFWRIDDELLRLESLPPLLRAGALRVARNLVGSMADPQRSPFTIGGAIRDTDDPDALAGLRQRITSHPLLVGTVIDRTGTSTAVVVRLTGMGEQDPKQTVADLREAADSFAERHGLDPPALVGPPVLLADGFRNIEKDGQRLAFVGMLLIGLVTLSATRSLWWAVVPIMAGWTVWLGTETILAFLGLRLSLSGGPLVAQIIVLTMPAASHLAIHFRDHLRRQADRREAGHLTLAVVTVPIVWSTLTTALGYGALVTSNVVPIYQFGAILAASTLMAALVTLIVSPMAMVPPFRLEVPVRRGSISAVALGMSRLIDWVMRHPVPIVLSVIVLVLPLTAGMLFLRYESNYINAFKEHSRVVQDYHFVETRLGGIGVVSLVVPTGETITPETLEAFRALDEEIQALRQGGAPAVSQVVSLATLLDPEGRLLALPPEKAASALATKLDLIAASPQGELLGSFWNRELGWARTVVRVPEQQPAQAKETTFVQALRLTRQSEAFGAESYLTGLSFLLTRTTRGVMATSWTTFVLAAVGILAMMVIAFRGPRLAVLALLPTLLAVGLVLGLMGWLDIKLDIATALVASVALGLSVDDTFHCLLQFRRHRREKSFHDSLQASYTVTGPGVLLSSLAVAVGFAVLWISEFVPFSNFGMMVGIATAGSTLGNLVLLPACLTLGARWRPQPTTPPREPRVPLETAA